MNNIVYGHGDGFLTQNRHRLWPIGFYELSIETLRNTSKMGN